MAWCSEVLLFVDCRWQFQAKGPKGTWETRTGNGQAIGPGKIGPEQRELQGAQWETRLVFLRFWLNHTRVRQSEGHHSSRVWLVRAALSTGGSSPAERRQLSVTGSVLPPSSCKRTQKTQNPHCFAHSAKSFTYMDGRDKMCALFCFICRLS